MHILVRNAVFKKKNNLPEEDESCYMNQIGAWIYKPTGEYLMRSTFDSRPKPMTKKADTETGEDLKSE